MGRGNTPISRSDSQIRTAKRRDRDKVRTLDAGLTPWFTFSRSPVAGKTLAELQPRVQHAGKRHAIRCCFSSKAVAALGSVSGSRLPPSGECRLRLRLIAHSLGSKSGWALAGVCSRENISDTTVSLAGRVRYERRGGAPCSVVLGWSTVAVFSALLCRRRWCWLRRPRFVPQTTSISAGCLSVVA